MRTTLSPKPRKPCDTIGFSLNVSLYIYISLSPTSMGMPTPSGSGAAPTRKRATQSGSAAAVGSVGVSSSESSDGVYKDTKVGNIPEAPFCNLWNQFQKAHKGKGWGTERMRAEYYKAKSEGKLKMPGACQLLIFGVITFVLWRSTDLHLFPGVCQSDKRGSSPLRQFWDQVQRNPVCVSS